MSPQESRCRIRAWTNSTANLPLTARLIARRREAVGSPWRKLDPGRQALLALAYLRKHDTLATLTRWFGVGATTAWRSIREVIALLEALAPSLWAGLWAACSRGLRWVLLDGTCCEIDRVKDRRDPAKPWSEHVDRHWCRKHRHHAVTLPALTDGEGNLLWIGTGSPGSTHDLTAARAYQVFYWAAKAGLEPLLRMSPPQARTPLRQPQPCTRSLGSSAAVRPDPGDLAQGRSRLLCVGGSGLGRRVGGGQGEVGHLQSQ